MHSLWSGECMRQVFWVSCMRSNFFTLSSFFLDFSYGQLLSLECSALRQFLYTTGKWPRRLVIIDRLKVGGGSNNFVCVAIKFIWSTCNIHSVPPSPIDSEFHVVPLYTLLVTAAAIFLLTQFHLRTEIIWVKTRIKRSLAKLSLPNICMSVVQTCRKTQNKGGRISVRIQIIPKIFLNLRLF